MDKPKLTVCYANGEKIKQITLPVAEAFVRSKFALFASKKMFIDFCPTTMTIKCKRWGSSSFRA